MSLQLDGQQMGELRQALANAFTPFTFPLMLKERLNKDFHEYGSPYNTFSYNLFEVIGGANREGWASDLVAKARETVPDNPKLYAVAQTLNLASVSHLELERYVEERQLLLDPDVWRADAGRIEARVCRIEIRSDQGVMIYGTGFLVAVNWVLTNYHVVEAVIVGTQGKTTERGHSAQPHNVVCRFDYKRLSGRQLNPGVSYQLDKDWLAASSPNYPLTDPEPPASHLDFALLQLKGTPGNDTVGLPNAGTGTPRGWVHIPDTIEDGVFNENMPLFIMQHPAPTPAGVDGLLKLALNTNAVIGLNKNKTRVRYRTNTLQGSSGAPCFSQTWELVALHHSGDPNFDPSHKPAYNQGIPFTAIRSLLAEQNIML